VPDAADTACDELAAGLDDGVGLDAVAVLGGGRGERLARGMAVREAAGAPVLVLSDGARRKDERRGAATLGRALAASDPGYEVLCPVPVPYSTRGEAHMVAALARDRRWRRVVVVTSDYHVRRAQLLMARCAPPGCRIDVLGARSPIRGFARADAVLHELGGLVYATVVARRC
jgi:uncharacterized SAM-binding protein YcdF (DUF218 family)